MDESALRSVLKAYAPDLDDSEVEQIGRDPFLISYGLVDTASRVVVSNEVSKPSKGNVKLIGAADRMWR